MRHRRISLILSLLFVVVLLSTYGQRAVVAQSDGTPLADTGFRPATDGFAFQNYTNESVQQNLTPVEMTRLFGNAVCADKNDPCTLTPNGQQVMDEVNKIMNGGHCEGMAALALVLYSQKAKASLFGGDTTPALTLQNPDLQREIAYYFTTQLTTPTADTRVKDKTPNEIVDMLTAAMKNGKDSEDFYAVEFFKRGFKGGHAVTPYAVVDKGNNIVWIMVYDNNFPGEERHIEVDKGANTWKYSAAASPDVPESLYEGDADTKTLMITPSAPRLKQQEWTFGPSNSSARVSGLARAATRYNQIALVSDSKENDANLLITDDQGHKIGYDGDKFVNDFPGARFEPLTSADLWGDDPEPFYYVPVGVAFTVTLDGSQLKGEEPSDVTMIGPGYNLGVEGIKLEKGQKDTLKFSADGKMLSYTTSQTESPNIFLGVETTGADYEFEIKGADIESGGTINVALDYDKGKLSFQTKDSKSPATYELHFTRYDDKGTQTFDHDGLTLDPGDTVYLDYGKWQGNGQTVDSELDKGSDGSIDSTTPEDDSSK